MNSGDILFFKKLFEADRELILKTQNVTDTNYHSQAQEMRDPMDLGAFEVDQEMRFRLRNRNYLLLQKISQALERIQKGTFGVCSGCEESIEVDRLRARPMTALCVSCKEAEELVEDRHMDGHRSKSLGRI